MPQSMHSAVADGATSRVVAIKLLPSWTESALSSLVSASSGVKVPSEKDIGPPKFVVPHELLSQMLAGDVPMPPDVARVYADAAAAATAAMTTGMNGTMMHDPLTLLPRQESFPQTTNEPHLGYARHSAQRSASGPAFIRAENTVAMTAGPRAAPGFDQPPPPLAPNYPERPIVHVLHQSTIERPVKSVALPRPLSTSGDVAFTDVDEVSEQEAAV